MKSGNKPSIFSDRSGIGSPAELDEYGVWVKIKPEEVGNGDIPDFEAGVFDENLKTDNETADFSGFDAGRDDSPESGGGNDFDLSTEDLENSLDFDETETAEPELDTEDGDAPPKSIAADTGAADTGSDNFDIPSFDIDDLLPDETVDSKAAETAAADESFDIDDITDDIPGIEREFDDVPEDAPFEAITLDEINAAPVVNDMINESVEPKPEKDEAPARGGLDTELLLKIANELSSIKTELTTLKSEVSSMQKAGVTAAQEAAPQENPPLSVREEAQSGPKGFFDDGDEDEKIALTGDELNNIINTSDIDAEKTGTDEAGIMAESETLSSSELDNMLSNSDLTEEVPPEIEPAAGTEIETEVDAEAEAEIETEVDAEIEPEAGVDAEPAAEGEAGETLSGDELAGIIDNAELTEETGISADEELSKLADEGFATPEENPSVDLQLEEPRTDEAPADFEFDMPEEQHEELEIPDINDILSPATEENGTDDDTPFARVDLSNDKFSLDKVFDDMIDDIPAEEPIIEEPVIDKETPVSSSEDGFEIDFPVAEDDETAQDGGENKFKNEIRVVLAYMDQLLESLPEEKIEEFARSDKFEIYKKVFKDLGLV
jgi:hypothetical protein